MPALVVESIYIAYQEHRPYSTRSHDLKISGEWVTALRIILRVYVSTVQLESSIQCISSLENISNVCDNPPIGRLTFAPDS